MRPPGPDALPRPDAIYRRAAELVAQGWCQQQDARDHEGTPVSSHAPEACQWCPRGAIDRALFEALGTRYWIARPEMRPLARELVSRLSDLCGRDITRWNDRSERSPNQVIRLLEIAAGDAEREEIP